MASTKRTKNAFVKDEAKSRPDTVRIYFEDGVAKDFLTDRILGEKEVAEILTAARNAKANLRTERLAARAERIRKHKEAQITRQKAQLARIAAQKKALANREAKLRAKLAA